MADVTLFYTRTEVIEDFKADQELGRDYLPKGIDQMGALRLWNEGKGEGSVIAVLDTGIDKTHPDLSPNIIGGRNFTTDYNGDPTNYQDNHHHGTHVAGTIAAAHNGTGVVGVAPKAKILALKVLKSDGSGSVDSIAEAIRYSIAWRGPNGEKVNVINMSLGTPSYHSGMHVAIKEAVANNIAVIVAVGNEGDGQGITNEISYPAYLPEVISVGAVDFDKGIALFTNTNPEVDVCANGVDVISSYVGGRYAILNGTSMACPHVAGFAVLLRGKFKNRFGRFPTEAELFTLIKFYTIDVAEAGLDSSTGAGFVTVFPDSNASLINY